MKKIIVASILITGVTQGIASPTFSGMTSSRSTVTSESSKETLDTDGSTTKQCSTENRDYRSTSTPTSAPTSTSTNSSSLKDNTTTR